MNILFTIYSELGKGGAEISTKILMEELKERGHNVFIASSGDYENVFKFKKIKNIPFYSYHNSYLKKFFDDIIKKNNIEIIYAQDRLTSIPAILAAQESKIKSVVHFRDYWFACPKSSCLMPNGKNCEKCKINNLIKCSSLKRFLWDYRKLIYLRKKRKILDKANIKFSNSNAVKEKLELCNIKNVIVMPNPINIKQFQIKDNNLRKKYKLKKIVITFIGNLDHHKGILNLLKIIPKVDADFLIVGDGRLKTKIIKFVRNHKNVNYLGKIAYNNIPKIYANSDIVVFPSIWEEPFGRIAIETMASGKVIVASNKGGIKDIIKHEKNGILIKTNSVNEWINWLNRLVKDIKLREKIAKEGKKTVRIYDKKIIAKKIENVWNNRF